MKMYRSTRRHRTKLLSLLCALAIFASLIPSVSAASNVSDDVLKKNVVSDTVTPAGVQLNLFDYWVDTRTSTDTDTKYASVKDSGINKDHYLKFISSGPTNPGDDNINQWTGFSSPKSGIVQNRLSGGYPVLNTGKVYGPTTSETVGSNPSWDTSLAYLFDKSDEDGTYGSTTSYKKTFWDVAGLLRVGQDGYYYYNANQSNVDEKKYESANYAYFNEGTNAFTLYNNWAVQSGGSSGIQGQFFPFTDPKTVFTLDGNNTNALTQASINSGDPAIHHYFGMTMTTRFVQRYNGMTTEGGNEAMTFQFAGDDDVWIFIDGVLVADLGGIHNQATTTINFSDGTITINSLGQDGYSTTNLKDVMSPYYSEEKYPNFWRDDTFSDDTYHTLKLFYLERGGTDSNLAMKFNLAYVPETDGIKVDQNGTLLPGVQFDLYAAKRTDNSDGSHTYTKVNPDSSTTDIIEPIGSGTTDEKGRFVLTNADDIAVSLNDLNKRNIQYLILEERNENRTGYRHDDSIYLVLQSNEVESVLLNDENHRWTTGTYAALKGSVATGPNITLSDTGKKINLDTASGKLFAVIMRRLNNVGINAPSATDAWGVVTGSALSGWQVTGRESGSYIPAVIKALQGNAAANGNAVVFTPAANGSYMAELKNCPGDLRNYYYWSKNADTAYTVAFYYTTASDLSEATVGNTHLVDGKDFDRQFAATIYIPNVQHHLYVKKVDDRAEQKPLSGAVFDLYTAESLTVTDGAYAINPNAVPYDTVTTGDDGLATFPSTAKKLLPAGKYYLVERTAPAGHTVNPTAVPILVDDEHGVMADAGTDNDGVAVTVAEGHLVPTMTPFATNDAIDRTLTNITSTKKTAASGWANTSALQETENTVDLTLDTESFKKDHPVQTLRYIPVNTENESLSWRTETGWLWFHIEQTPIADSDPDKNLKTDLGDRDLTRLFTGETTVVVTNQRVGSLEIRKTVTDLTNAATDLPASYALEIALNGGAYNGEVSYTSKVGNAAAQTGKLQFTDGKKTYNIQPDETLTLLDLPLGTTWSVEETAELPAANWRTTVNGQPGKEASGEIKEAGQRATVAIVNSYDDYDHYDPATLTGFRVSKTYATGEGKAIYDGSVTFKLEATGANAASAPLPPTQTEISLTKAQIENGDAASFDDLTFTSTGTYTYTIREVPTPVTSGQMIWDDALYTITVSVTEGNHQLIPTVKSFTVTRNQQTTIPDIPLCTFENSYTPAPTTGTLTVTKKVETAPNSTAPDANQTFPIQITLKNADDNAYTGTIGNLTFDRQGQATWTAKNGGSLTLTLPIGTKWDVTELTDHLTNPTRWSVKVNGNAVNTANGTISKEASTVSVVNTYSYIPAPTSVDETITVSKTYDQSADGMSIYSGEMEFTIEGIEGTATPQTASAFVRGAGPASFYLTFSQPGSYIYQITERKLPAISGMTYDPATYTVRFAVERDPATGQLIVNRQCQKDGETYEDRNLAFENTYREPPKTGTLRLEKAIGEGVTETAFQFKVTIPGLAGGTYGGVTFNGGEATVDITPGTPVDITNLPAGAQYTVTELNADNYSVSYQGETGSIPESDAAICTVTNALTGGGDVPGPGPGPNPGGDDGGTPALNRRDHYAYIIGYPDGDVHPQGNITRAEVATIFFRLLRDPVRTQYWSQTNSYSDVAGDKWYNNAISTLSNMGIICGYPDGTFRPDAPITRAELTKIAAGFFSDPRVAATYDGRFSDVHGAEWYISYLMTAIKEGLIEGYPDGSFRPDRPITRAETCTIVNRTLGRKPDKDHLLPESAMINWPDNLDRNVWYYAQMQEATNSHDYRWTSVYSEVCEQWTAKLIERDWAALERTWSHAHSAPGGEVMQ